MNFEELKSKIKELLDEAQKDEEISADPDDNAYYSGLADAYFHIINIIEEYETRKGNKEIT